jgi:hypothetical protein
LVSLGSTTFNRDTNDGFGVILSYGKAVEPMNYSLLFSVNFIHYVPEIAMHYQNGEGTPGKGGSARLFWSISSGTESSGRWAPIALRRGRRP